MALKTTPCVRCGASPLSMVLWAGEGWVCTSHFPPVATCRHGRELCDECEVDRAILEERERCAKVCETVSQNWSANNDEYKAIALMCAEEIRKAPSHA